jgi:hypothetical protein
MRTRRNMHGACREVRKRGRGGCRPDRERRDPGLFFDRTPTLWSPTFLAATLMST